MSRIALVRRPTTDLAAGQVTHIERVPVDVDLAMEQHAAYCQALTSSGWQLHHVDPAPGCPDAVFVEDSVVVVDSTAVLTRSGSVGRRGELDGTERAVRQLGLEVRHISGEATLDGGDVLQVGNTMYVGRGGRTNAEGVRQLRQLVTPLGRTVIPVRLLEVLHLKSAVTALPDGTMLALPDLIERGVIPAPRPVDEEAGCHVVPLGPGEALISASAPRTAEHLADLGYDLRVVDISEFEKLEGCVTCLSVLISLDASPVADAAPPPSLDR